MPSFLERVLHLSDADDLTPVERWRERVQGMTREQFVAGYPDPVLLVHMAAATDEETPAIGFEMHHLKHDTIQELTRKALESTGYVSPYRVRGVLSLVKTKRNPWAQHVMLGRARNNDVIIAETGVSKLHARFLIDASTFERVLSTDVI